MDKNQIIKALTEKNDGDIQELVSVTNAASGSDFIALTKLLNQMETDGLIFTDDKDRYHLIDEKEYMIGEVRIKRNGSAFIEEMPVGKNGPFLLNNDQVIYRLNQRHEAEILKILHHEIIYIVGTVRTIKKHNRFYSDDYSLKDFKIVDLDRFHLKNNTKIRAIITDYEQKLAKVESIIGDEKTAQTRELSILFSSGVPLEFSSTAQNEAKLLNSDISIKDPRERKDLTDELIITIDGDDAKDFDDAISLTKEDNGYRLKVHIADVSHYVKPGSAIDNEAYKRGTSIYYANKVLPMLPFVLADDLCSLKEGEKRLTLTVDMFIDHQGEIIRSDIYRSVICSKKRLTYNLANQMLHQPNDEALTPMLQLMKELSDLLDAGSQALDFEDNEPVVVINNDKVIDIHPRITGASEKIIENFMIAANKTVAETMYHLELPMIYRNHPEPKSERLAEFVAYMSELDYVFKGDKQNIYPSQLKACLNTFVDTPYEYIVANKLLRAMAKARYESMAGGHYGLSLSYYCHFTSPIRRYPDLIVHRMVKKYLIDHDYTDYDTDLAFNQDIAEDCSKKERRAVEVERDILDLKECEFMKDKIGHEYSGIITSVVSFGLFVRLDNTIEGLVHLNSMNGYFSYDEKRGILYNDTREYKLLDKVKIKVKQVDLNRLTIDFSLI